jgi:hypothetical protein
MAVVVGTGVVLKGTKGDPGAQGQQGVSRLYGTGAPTATTFANYPAGSSYVQTENGEVWGWNGTAVSDTGYSMRGSRIWSGSGAFSSSNFPQAIGGMDYYFQTDTQTYYPLVNQ